MSKVNLNAAFSKISAPWTPHIIGELNGQEVKLAKANESFVWHRHKDIDELFLVVQGSLEMHLKDASGKIDVLTLEAGELFIVPRGVEHKPVAKEGGAHLLLFEPSGVRNTGDVRSEHTIEAKDLKHL